MARANGSTSGANGAAGRSRAVVGPAKFIGFLGGLDCDGKPPRRPGSWFLLYMAIYRAGLEFLGDRNGRSSGFTALAHRIAARQGPAVFDRGLRKRRELRAGGRV